MQKFKVFLSSVQAEFANERQLLYDFIRKDELLSQYFEPFIFERIAAQDTNPKQLYLDEASHCQIYLLLIGQRNEEVQNKAEFEIPRSVIFETIVNAVVHRDYNSKGSVQVAVCRNRIVVRNPGMLPVELTKADLLKEHGSYPHNPQIAEAMYQAGYIEKYGTGITENIRKMQEAHLLAPDIDLSAEFITTIWRPNVATSGANIATSGANIATSEANIATSGANVATDFLAENKRLIDSVVAPKVVAKMSQKQIRECIIEACTVEHSIEELATLLHKTPAYLRNFIIPDMVAECILLRTKPFHSPGQTYMTNPKYKNTK